MATDHGNAHTHPLATSLDCLSKGVDRILERWQAPDRPSKLTLLNDLAHAIRPGANWGALMLPSDNLKTQATEDQQTKVNVNHAVHLPNPPKNAAVLPARLFQIESGASDTSIFDLTNDTFPLFSLHHKTDPIIGLELSVWEGRGDCDVSIFTRFILSRGNKVFVESVHALEMKPEVARLVFLAVQNLQYAAIYPTFAQADCGRLRIILGSFHVAAALPDLRSSGAKPDVPSQGVRILFDEHEIPSTSDLDKCLRLVSASLPHLELETFPQTDPVQFRISQPRVNVWKPVDFEIPEAFDGRTLYREVRGGNWVHDADFVWKKRFNQYGVLGEALDLALALIDIDDPNLYLHVSLTSAPKRKQSDPTLPGWRGGIVVGWRILKLLVGLEPQVLSLDATTQGRLDAGLNGWAVHKGYSVGDGSAKAEIQALLPRGARRASHHLEQVRALMDGADPNDVELMRSLKT